MKVATNLIMGLALIVGLSPMRMFTILEQNTFALGLSTSKVAKANLLLTHVSARATNNQKELRDTYTRSPLSFEEIVGQEDRQFGFLSRGNGYSVFLTPSKAFFALHQPGTSFPSQAKKNRMTAASCPNVKCWPAALTMKLIGANPESKGSGLGVLSGKSNYFIGSDPKQWRTNVINYAKVQYENVYPGIALVYYGNHRQLEYDFVLSPGSDPRQIKLAFDGARKVSIAETGELVVRIASGEMRQPKPSVYQEVNGVRREIAGRYHLLGKQEVGIIVGDYDRNQVLTIDPVLIYSTYFGGLNDDYGNGIEADAAGNVYITGITYSDNFPTKNAMQHLLHGVGNAFVAKFNPSGALIYSSYIGGSKEDVGFAITIDANGGTYITGSTDSSDFPITASAFQKQKQGQIDAFVTKLNAAGDAIVYSTFLGGKANNIANSIAIDASGNAYVTGETTSSNFPTTQSAYQRILSGPSDAFVSKLNAAGSNLAYSTFLGGMMQETGFGIAVDNAGSAYVTGLTSSNNFPARNPVQSVLSGLVDMFIAKLTAAGNDLTYSTYLGGANDDGGFGIGLDTAGNAYVSGFTTSINFPTKNAFQSTSGGGDDAVILKLDQAGRLVYSSYLGGSGEDRSFDLAVDKSGNSYLAGRTQSANFPVKNAIQPAPGALQKQDSFNASLKIPRDGLSQMIQRVGVMEHYNRASDRWDSTGDQATRKIESQFSALQIVPDGFVAKVDPNGLLIYSTFLGGDGEDRIFAVTIDNASNAYVTGLTIAANFPTKSAVQQALAGRTDVFITKIADTGGNQTSVSAASFSRSSFAADEITALFGTGLATETRVVTSFPLPTELALTRVKVIDSTNTERFAQLFFISPAQINYLIPAGTANGPARVVTYRDGVVMSDETIQISTLAPGIFSANSNGEGLVAGVVLRVKFNGTTVVSQTYESIVRYDSMLRLFVGIPIDLGAETDRVYLVLFGTGFHNLTSMDSVSQTIGGLNSAVTYAGPQGQLLGLEQLNMLVPRSLAGRGKVNVVLTIGGKVTNPVNVIIK